MKIVCDCGNEIDFPIKNKDEGIEIGGSLLFTIWMGINYAGIYCESCGREIYW